jgi:protein O-GlcNAc transferase
LSHAPKLLLAYLEWGKLLQSQGKLDEAIEKYQKVTELDPKSYLAYKFCADTLKQQGKLNEAKKIFHKASEVDPTIHRR